MKDKDLIILQVDYKDILKKNVEWINYFLNKKHMIYTIMFSGGLAMNIKLNQKIDEQKEKKNKFFAAPSSDDYSHALFCYFFIL